MANNPADFGSIPVLSGRKKIVLDFEEVTDKNVVDIIEASKPLHDANRHDIEYLYNYYKGIQPILGKTREYQQEINNIVVENRASQIVNFKEGQLMRKPIQFVSAENADNADQIKVLNNLMRLCRKHQADKRIIKWMLIGGIGYRFAMATDPKYSWQTILDTRALDPRDTESIYSSGFGKPLLMTYTHRKRNENGMEKDEYRVYTESVSYHIIDGKIVEKNTFFTNGINPIIPYELNDERIGCFEWVINLLDNINEVQSGRLDSLAQFINSLLLFHNVDVENDDIKRLRELNAIVYGDRSADMTGEIKYLTSELNQSQVQTLVNYMWQAVLEIVGMPNRNGGSSTSDTGAAVVNRDGWSDSEQRAADTEEQYSISESDFLVIVCEVLQLMNVHLDPTEVNTKFTRRIYENQQSKAQTLTTMLGSEKIAPRLAFVASDMWSDPEEAWKESEKWYNEHKQDNNPTTTMEVIDEEKTDTGNGD